MKKNIKWLKDGIKAFQVDENMFTAEFNEGVQQALEYVQELIDQLDEPELPVIPKVEEEQKYQVIIRDGEYIRLFLCKHGDNVMIGTNDNYIEKCPEVTYLTEKEIKDYDERYWVFAQEVMEGKKMYEISVHGCDDSTTIEQELMFEEYELLKEIAEKITNTSTYGCMPTMVIREKKVVPK